MITVSIFASAAVFLAVLTVYGRRSQGMRERSREVGIRTAIGCERAGLTPASVMAGLTQGSVDSDIGALVAANAQ